MFTILSLLSLIVLSVQGQIHWTNGAGDGLWSTGGNWEGGMVPGAASVVILDSSMCTSCDSTMDIVTPALSIAELHIGSDTESIYLDFTGVLTVTTALTVGKTQTTSPWSVYLRFAETSGLTTTDTTATTLMYSGGGNTIYYNGITGGSATITLAGTVTTVTNGGITTAGRFYIGDSGRGINVVSTAIYDCTEPLVQLYFYYLGLYTHDGGSFDSTWTTETSPEPTVAWYSCDIEVNQNMGSTGPLYIESSSSGYIDSSFTLANLNFFHLAAADLIISNVVFDAMNVIFDDNSGNLFNCNMTYYTYLTSSMSTTCNISGISWMDTVGILCTDDTMQFTVIVDAGSIVYRTGSVSLQGNVLFINDGESYWDNGYTFYMDAPSFYINMGYLQVSSSSTSIYYSSVNGNADVGTVVNKGTIEFHDSGALYFYSSSGSSTFYQCEDAIMKYIYGYPTDTDYPSYSNFHNVYLDGYIGVYFAEGWTTTAYENLFYWDPTAYVDNFNEMWEGDLSVTSSDDANTIPEPQQICYWPSSGSYGYAYIYPISDGSCDSQYSEYVFLSAPYLGTDVCEEITDTGATNYIDSDARCSIGNCGTPTGIASSPEPDPASALTVSFTFLISLLAYLLFL